LATHPSFGTLNTLGISSILEGIQSGTFSSEDVVRDCLARVQLREPDVGAWAHLDPQYAMERSRCYSSRPLRGLPFGVKDVIDTSMHPTEMGSGLYAGNTSKFDAGCVAQLRSAGAIVLGKTRTCEFAGVEPTITANPLDLQRTPGGSSSGSAAAVADYMVPFALGTQTGGSVLRPASFCGIVGFKPTYGLYSIAGVKLAAPSFDTIGMFTRSVEDAALIHAILMNTRATPENIRNPVIGIVRNHYRENIEPTAVDVFESAVSKFLKGGARITEIAVPNMFAGMNESRAIINSFERGRSLAGELADDRTGVSKRMKKVCDNGLRIFGEDYVEALRKVNLLRSSVDLWFEDVDFLISPTTAGVAPVGLADTGDPRLQEIWTMLHTPTITVPSGNGPGGMPLGLQIVGRRYSDDKLLKYAAWAEKQLV
jgi:Asp-tRNA(Asn)/Glu-tRNA(Gln) amidotransferase A subunit family amidase